jgi:hypothetical protein
MSCRQRTPSSKSTWLVCAALCVVAVAAIACSKKTSQAAAAGGDTAAGAAEACGDKGQPECPLQGFMSKNLQDPLDAANTSLVGKNVTRVADFVPDPTWNTGNNSWSSLVQGVATAAESGDVDSTREACKNCHRAWRKRYKDEFRHRPLPN